MRGCTIAWPASVRHSSHGRGGIDLMLVALGTVGRRGRIAGEAGRGGIGRGYGFTGLIRIYLVFASLEVVLHFFAGQLVLREDCFIELELPVGLVQFAYCGVRVLNVIYFEGTQLQVDKTAFC